MVSREFKHRRFGRRTSVVSLTLSLPECLMEFCDVTLTFESVYENLLCDHSNESSQPVLSHLFFKILQNEI